MWLCAWAGRLSTGASVVPPSLSGAVTPSEELGSMNVTARVFRDEEDLGQGVLTISPEKVTFSDLVSIEYPALVLHEICNDPEAFAQPCIYCQIDEEKNGEDVKELRIVLEDSSLMQKVFDELSRCSNLHPCDMDEEYGDGESFEMNDMVVADSAYQPAFVVPGQFDEADDL